MKYAFFIASLLLAGCSNSDPVPPPIPGVSDPYDRRRINLEDPDLQGAMVFGEPIVTPQPTGIVQVVIPVRSVANQPYAIQFRPTFTDKNGAPESESAYLRLDMPPNSSTQIVFNSLRPDPTDWHVNIRFYR